MDSVLYIREEGNQKREKTSSSFFYHLGAVRAGVPHPRTSTPSPARVAPPAVARRARPRTRSSAHTRPCSRHAYCRSPAAAPLSRLATLRVPPRRAPPRPGPRLGRPRLCTRARGPRPAPLPPAVVLPPLLPVVCFCCCVLLLPAAARPCRCLLLLLAEPAARYCFAASFSSAAAA